MESSEVLRLDAEPELSLVAIDGAIPERQGHLFNWEELQIEEWLDDGGEGRMELIDEDKMYCLLGLRTEDDDGQSAANATSSAAIPDQATANDDGQSAANANATSSAAIPDIDTRGAAIPVDDAIPEESARRYTTTPTAAWVASRGMKYLIKDSNMGPNQLRKELEAEHGCTIGYDVVADGRNIANKILHGTWEDSFQLLYNWRAEILKHSPNSVIEIDTLMVDGKWPIVELPFKVWAPLDKKGAGRYRKLRIKGCLEGGSGGKGKKAAKEAANEADNAAAEEEAMQAGKPKRQLLRGKRTCKGCGELGHTESSYKCRLNGTKKRKRKPRLNTTKYGKNGEKKSKKAAQNSPVHAAEPPVGAENEVVVPENVIVVAENALVVAENALAPQPENALAQPENALAQPENALAQPENAPVTDKANILANSPERLTRSRLAEIIGEGPSTLLNVTKPNKQAKTSPKQRKKQAKTSPKKAIAKKLTPRKLKTT